MYALISGKLSRKLLEEARAVGGRPVMRWTPQSGMVNGIVFKLFCPLEAPLLHSPPSYFSARWNLLCIHHESGHPIRTECCGCLIWSLPTSVACQLQILSSTTFHTCWLSFTFTSALSFFTSHQGLSKWYLFPLGPFFLSSLLIPTS